MANDLDVRLPAIDERPDPDIAHDAIAAIKNELPDFPRNHQGRGPRMAGLRSKTRSSGSIIKKRRERRASDQGVKRVSNMIAVKRAEPTEIWKKIREALKRDAEVDANRALQARTPRTRTRGVLGTGRDLGGR